jgi:hypothetical protein
MVHVLPNNYEQNDRPKTYPMVGPEVAREDHASDDIGRAISLLEVVEEVDESDMSLVGFRRWSDLPKIFQRVFQGL